MALTLEYARQLGYEKDWRNPTKPVAKSGAGTIKKATPKKATPKKGKAKKAVSKSPSAKKQSRSRVSKKVARPTPAKVGDAPITITENLEKLGLADLNDILEKHRLAKSDIQGTGKSGRVLKSDIILAIKDHEARSHDGKPLKIRTAEKKKGVKKSPKKSIKIVPSPVGAKRIVSVEKLTAVEALEELRKHKKYAKMTDYQIKKSIGGSQVAKIAELRQEVRNLMGDAGLTAPAKKSPAKKSPKKKSASGLKCEDRKKCPGKYCDTHNGKCVSKNKDGKPRGEKSLKEEIGEKYTYNEKYGLVGSEDDVKAHIKHWKKIHAEKKKKTSKKSPVKKTPPKKTPAKKSPAKKSPAKKKTAKRCASSDMKSFEGYNKCDEDEACDVLTGNCIDNAKITKSGQHILKVDGRTIVGDAETIKKLQKVLGGNMSLLHKKDKKQKTPQTPEEKKPEKPETPEKPKSPKKTPKKTPEKPKTPEKQKPSKPTSAAVGASREDIYRTFSECLKSLK